MDPFPSLSPLPLFPAGQSSPRVLVASNPPRANEVDEQLVSTFRHLGQESDSRSQISFESERSNERVPFQNTLMMLSHDNPTYRFSTWEGILKYFQIKSPLPSLARTVFEEAVRVLGQGTAPEMSVVARLVPHLLSSLRAGDTPDFFFLQNRIMCAVMDAVIPITRPTEVLKLLLKALYDFEYSRPMQNQLAARAPSLLSTAVSCMKEPLEASARPLLLYLVASVIFACENTKLHFVPRLLDDDEVKIILKCIEAMFHHDVNHSFASLHFLKDLISTEEVLREFVDGNADEVMMEIRQFGDLKYDRVRNMCIQIFPSLAIAKTNTIHGDLC